MPVDIVLPQWGMGMNDGMVVKWLKKEGDAVKKGDPLVEIESSKVNAEVESTADGTLGRIVVREGVVALVGATLAVLLLPGDDPASLPAAPAPRASAAPSPVAAPAAPPVPAAAPAMAASAGPKQVTPVARSLAKQLGVDLDRLTGTGPNGRVTEEDVRRAASAPAPAPAAPAAPATPAPSVLPVKQVMLLTGMRGTIARRMTESAQAPMVTLNTHADVTATAKLMEKLVSDWRQHRLRPQYQDVVLGAVARALREHPRVNAHLAGNEIRVLEPINLGVAMAVPEGLLVPVIRDAGTRTVLQIAQAVRELAQKAKANKLAMDDMTGATFTITNLGGYDVESFNPLIDPPQVAILGVGRVEERPAVAGGQVVIRSIGHLSLTFDHRALDGAPAGEFLRSVVKSLQDPSWAA